MGKPRREYDGFPSTPLPEDDRIKEQDEFAKLLTEIEEHNEHLRSDATFERLLKHEFKRLHGR